MVQPKTRGPSPSRTPSAPGILMSPMAPHRPHPRTPHPPEPPAEDDSTNVILKQPETRAISQEQLVAEVKGIYAGLVMVESKCIEVDNNQSSPNDPGKRLNNQQWQAMIALHRTLLQEHHDFFLASQHPSASAALRRLAAKYAMPARMWRHGIHSFLELLRHRLPGSLDHMLTFIYMAYSMMALLYETVPAFEDTWIECLGDLGRYRMAIEDVNIQDREVWTAVSRQWYSRASDKAPTTGRLYHHLAILSRPSALQQLSYYTKSLCVEIPFASARESIMTLFDPTMSPQLRNQQHGKLPPTELSWVKAHGILFSGKPQDDLELAMHSYLELIDSHISRSTRKWLESGYQTAIANVGALTGYGDQSNLINVSRNGAKTIPNAKQFPNALDLLVGTYDMVCLRFGDSNILLFFHGTSFMGPTESASAPHIISQVQAQEQALARLLEPGGRLPGNEVGGGDKEAPPVRRKRPLPDDFAMRGFQWDKWFDPHEREWFDPHERIDDDEKYFEVLSMERRERTLWLGARIAERENGRWLQFANPSPTELNFVKAHGMLETLAPQQSRRPPHARGASAWGRRNRAINTILRPFRALLLLFFTLATVPLVSADPYRPAKTLLLGSSALTSLGTSLAAVQINDSTTKVCLRIASSVCVAVLSVGYPLCFLRAAHRNALDFISGLSACALILTVFVRLNPASGASTGQHDDAFAWIDTADFIGLAAVVVGILNAESRLLGGICSQAQVSGGDGGDEEAIALGGLDDEENPSRGLVAAPGAANGGIPTPVVARLTCLLAVFGVAP